MTSQEESGQAKQMIAVLVDACANAARHYDSSHKGFVALDAKAQGVASVSGLVLAAIAAFSRDGRPPVLAPNGW